MNHASTPWASILAPSSLAADYPRVIESYRAHFPSSTIDLSDGRALYRHFRGSSLGRGDNDGALELGAALLSAFVQLNYTGPALVDGNGDVWKLELHEKLDDNSKDVDSAALRALQVDGEQAYALCQQPLLLLLARAALEYAVDPCDNDSTHPSAHWWLARCLFTQQQLLENATSTLYELIIEQLARTRELLDDDSGDLSRASLALLRAKLALFRGLVQHHHRQDKLAYASFCEAQKMTGLEWKLTGALGKRTKFQTFDIAQLVLDAKSVLESEDASKGEGVNADTIAEPAPVNVPRELALNDDTLLEGIAFTQDRPATSTNQHLHTLDQCLLLAFCHNIKNTNPDHGITHEQMAPFITRVIASPQNFTVHTMALLLRSRLDAVKSRTVERGVLQLQALVDQFAVTDVEEGGAEARERMEWVWEMLMPARWMMKKELGERFCAVGMIRSGMGMFEELEMWEEVVACLQNMDEEAKAEKIVTGLLEKTPDSPKLLCILGDLRQDPALWQRAWDVSGSRYARAMRTLGSWHYRRQDYPLAIECYEHALSINALFESTWFTLGCAAMQVDNWPVAQRAFLRCVEIEPGNGEAWNNLAAIHIKCSRKLDAFRCLREGLKEQYDNWKMWENFLFLSLDLGEFGESLCAVDRLLETNWGKQRERIDVGAVRVLCEGVLGLVAQLNKELHGDATSGVESNIEGADCTDDGTLATTTTHFRIVDRVEHLLDRIIAEFDSTNPELFDIAARFHTARNHHKRALDARLAAYRTVSQSAVGEEALSDAEAFEQLAAVAMALVEAYEVAQREGVVADGPFQSRLLLRNLVKKTKDAFEGEPTHLALEALLERVRQQ